MGVNTSSKGGRIELKVRFFLEKHGYEVERSRLSKGAFDLIATRKHASDGLKIERRFIQVKANQWRMGAEDLRIMSTIPLPEGSVREYIRHDDHPRKSGMCASDTPQVACLRARRVAEDGTWRPIAMLPEWEDEQPLERASGGS